eukprot:9368942-Pyramimonas_sp.AAC.1
MDGGARAQGSHDQVNFQAGPSESLDMGYQQVAGSSRVDKGCFTPYYYELVRSLLELDKRSPFNTVWKTGA